MNGINQSCLQHNSISMNSSIKKEILDLAGQSLTVNSPIRYGQAVFNAAYQLYPWPTDQLRATEYDPFYDDDRVDKFIDRLEVLLLSSLII